MNIKDVENLLSVSRSNIRFYEQQGLLSPERRSNNYRDYSDADIMALKKIILFRKIGFTVEEIRSIQAGELSMEEALPVTRLRLESEIEQLTGALRLIDQISMSHLSVNEIDICQYWESVHESEQSGNKFRDICKDYLQFELYCFDNMWQNVFLFPFKKVRERHGVCIACCILLLLCVLRGLAAVFRHQSFWSAFVYPFALALIGSVIVLPLYILSKKSPRVAAAVSSVLLTWIVLFLVILTLIMIFAIIKTVVS